jgi:tetratricopeptide (TPR) repeat protein
VFTLYNLGFLHDEQGRPAEAQDCYDWALAIDPKHMQTLCNMGVLHDEKAEGAVGQGASVLVVS